MPPCTCASQPARQAEHDVSIPDQRRQGEGYCTSRGYQLVETYVEPGASATNDRRPEFQRMIEAGISKPAPFDVVVVHSFSRFFRDHFELEFYVRKLARNGIKLVSFTQEMGDDPMHVMMRQIMALFDEYQSKENAKHVLRALKENARQGFWNGSLPPIGYRVIAAARGPIGRMNAVQIISGSGMPGGKNRRESMLLCSRSNRNLVRLCQATRAHNLRLCARDAGLDMKKTLAAIMLLALAPAAQARPIDWQAELDRCRALREQIEPLLLAGQGLSPIARSGAALRRCVWIERRALRHGAR